GPRYGRGAGAAAWAGQPGCVRQPGQRPVTLRTPVALARSTIDFTTANAAPCSAAAVRISPRPRSSSVARGTDPPADARRHARSNTAPTSAAAAAPSSIAAGRYARRAGFTTGPPDPDGPASAA